MCLRKPAERALLAGFSTTNIIPELPIPLGGYIARRGMARSIHKDIYLKTIALSDGKKIFLIGVFDLTYLKGQWVEMIKHLISESFSIPPTFQLLCATHNHSAPPADPHISSRELKRYLRSLEDLVLEGVKNALLDLKMVKLYHASSQLSGVSSYRTHKDPRFSPKIDLLVFESPSKNALLVNFPCHLTTLGPENNSISSELFGVSAERLLSSPGIDFVAFTNGASADLGTRYTRSSHGFSELERLSRILSNAVLGLLEKKKMIPPLPLEVFEGSVSLPLKSPPSRERALSFYKKTLADLKSPKQDHQRLRSSTTLSEAASILLERAKRPSPMPEMAYLQVLKLGKLILAGVPAEIFYTTGQKIKKRFLRRKTLIIGYANDYLGYITPRRVPARSYEVLISPFSPKAEDVLLAGFYTRIQLRNFAPPL
jgi:hypothetical protein